jgi:hypothetical protein
MGNSQGSSGIRLRFPTARKRYVAMQHDSNYRDESAEVKTFFVQRTKNVLFKTT